MAGGVLKEKELQVLETMVLVTKVFAQATRLNVICQVKDGRESPTSGGFISQVSRWRKQRSFQVPFVTSQSHCLDPGASRVLIAEDPELLRPASVFVLRPLLVILVLSQVSSKDQVGLVPLPAPPAASSRSWWVRFGGAPCAVVAFIW